MIRWFRLKPSAEQLRRAEREASRARAEMAKAGLARATEPDPVLVERAVTASFEVVERMRNAEQEALEQVVRGRTSLPRTHLTARRGLVLAGAIAAVTAAAVAVTTLVPGGVSPASASTPPPLPFSQVTLSTEISSAASARATLLDLATRASSQTPDPPQASGGSDGYTLISQSWALASRDDARGRTGAVVPFTTTTTVGPDGAASRTEHLGAPLTADGRSVISGDISALTGPVVQHDTFPAGTVDVDLPATLPREPGALRQALLQKPGCPQEPREGSAAIGSYGLSCLVNSMTELYSFQRVPPDLQAALWKMLADETSVKLAGNGTDRAGRPCVAVVLETSGQGQTQRWTLMASPISGAYLGIDKVLVKGVTDGFAAPVVLDFTTELS